VAIATVERDPARDAGTPDLRFRLQQQVCGSPAAGFWRALDRRSGKSCVVRVIEADREQSSRRLGELHRERTLAERIGHPGVLRAEVPTIEAERIVQVVDPEPARAVDADSEGGRLAVLNLLVGVASILAEAHARGVFHGFFGRGSCLRTGDGRVLVQGFMGDAASAAAVREGAAADHRAFLEFATEMLRQTGGPPPRLRRYFVQFLSESAPPPTATAMADLCAELRESLEDTFPWPLAGPAVGATVPEDSPTLTLPILQPDARVAASAPASTPARVVLLPHGRTSQTPLPPPSPVVEVAPREDTRHRAADQPLALAAPMPLIAGPIAEATTPSGPPAVSRAATREALSRETEAALSDIPVLQQLTASPAAPTARGRVAQVREDEPRDRGARPWAAALFVLLAVALTLYFTSRSRVPATPAASVAAPAGKASGQNVTAAVATAARDAGTATAVSPAGVSEAKAMRPAPLASPPRGLAGGVAVAKPATAATRAPAATVTPGSSAAPAGGTSGPSTTAAERTTTAADGATPSPPQAARNRVATLVAGGNRALNALEPGAAAERLCSRPGAGAG
jgi:hypothetical protein